MAKVKITEELIEQGKSQAGGWNARQLGYLRVRWPLEEGWRERIVGTEVMLESAAKFLELRRGGIKMGQTKMYLIYKTRTKILSHIVKPEDEGKLFQDFAKAGDSLCGIVSEVRKEGKEIKKGWNLRSTYLQKVCKRCLMVEDQMIEASLSRQREAINGPKSIGTAARSDP
jgi:hypothetical protein